MADINDRLERLRRREEFATRAQQRPLAQQSPLDGTPFATGLGEDFVDVLDAVARAVLRHPGLSVLVTTGRSGRQGRTVVRVSERDGAVETALVVAPPAAAAGEPRRSGRHAEQTPPGRAAAAPSVTVLPASGTAGAPYQRTERQPYSRRGPVRQLRAVEDSHPGGEPEDAEENAVPADTPRDTRSDASPRERPVSADGSERAEDQPEAARSGLLALPPDTSQVVARLAQLLRDDPSLAAGWARER